MVLAKTVLIHSNISVFYLCSSKWHSCKHVIWKGNNERVSNQYAALLLTQCGCVRWVVLLPLSGSRRVYGRLTGWQAQMKDMFSSHLGTGGLTGWLHHMINGVIATDDCGAGNNYITLINLPRRLQSWVRGFNFTLCFSHLIWSGPNNQRADWWMLLSSRKHICQCGGPVFETVTKPPDHPVASTRCHVDTHKKNDLQW